MFAHASVPWLMLFLWFGMFPPIYPFFGQTFILLSGSDSNTSPPCVSQQVCSLFLLVILFLTVWSLFVSILFLFTGM